MELLIQALKSTPSGAPRTHVCASILLPIGTRQGKEECGPHRRHGDRAYCGAVAVPLDAVEGAMAKERGEEVQPSAVLRHRLERDAHPAAPQHGSVQLAEADFGLAWSCSLLLAFPL